MRFFHVSDIHFGVENYGKVDPKTGIHTRLLDFVHSLATVIDAAIEQQIDFFVFCGDAYKTAYPTPTQQKFLLQQLLRLYDAGIPVVIVVGNHDHPLSFGKAHALEVMNCLPTTGFYVFSKPDLVVIPTKSGEVQVIGMPWPMRNNIALSNTHKLSSHQEVAQALASRIGELMQFFVHQLDTSKPAIFAGHLTVSNGIFSGSEKTAIFGTDPTLLPSQLALAPLDYIALGHLHRHQNLNPGGIPLVYAGSIERVDFGERKEEKGYCDVLISPTPQGRATSYAFVPLATRPMVQVEVQLDGGKDQTMQIVDALALHKLDQAIVKVIYHVQPGKADRVDLQAVLRACSPAMHVVGVLPVHTPVVRDRRVQVAVSSDVRAAINAYVQAKPELASRAQSLTTKAYELLMSLEQKADNEQ